MRKSWFVALAMAMVVAGSIAASGCGSSGSDPSEQQLEAARKQGEKAAQERDRVDRLQHQVNHLKRQVHGQGATAPTEPSGASSQPPQNASSQVVRTFHAPSGNVSCEILSNGAICSVDSVGKTFSFAEGEAARAESGALLPRGAGELAPYGATMSSGSITCTVPNSNEPRGIVCSDAESGHGFEASRVSARQNVY